MSERKGTFIYQSLMQIVLILFTLVLNKYFPPDFDPSLIPRRKQPKNSQQVVRLMAPFSMYLIL